MTTTISDPQAGDHLVASWGYDQTNATFYKVTKRTPKMVTLVEVQAEKFEDTDRLAPTRKPVFHHDWKICEVDDFHSPAASNHREQPCYSPKVIRRKVQPDGWVRITTWGMIARVYEGGGAYDTIAAGLPGH